jgi:hypothetical protein
MILGTVFVHAVANLYTTFAANATLTLLTEDPVVLSADEGGLQLHEQASSTQGGLTLNIGNLQYGQSRNIVVRYEGDVKDAPSVEARLTFNSQSAKNPVASKGVMELGTGCLSVQASEYHRSRARLCAFFRSLFPTKNHSDYIAVRSNELSTARSNLEALAHELKAAGHTDEQNISLFQDLAGEDPQGQAGLAISSDLYFKKWGKHYRKFCVHQFNAREIAISNPFP